MYREFEEKRSRRGPLFLTLLMLAVIAAAIALANLSSVHVSVNLLDSSPPERNYGWPLNWYWRSANCVPGQTSIYDPWPVTPGRLQWPVSRYKTPALIADLAIWLAILAATLFASKRLLHRYGSWLNWRPRVTTFFVLAIVAAPTMLANLTFDSPQSWKASFGWPFAWYWYVCVDSKGLGPVHGWDYSAIRLVGNLVVWLLMFAAVGLAWERILSRYQPGLRWSLRTLLVAVGLTALFCAWCAAVRNRARDQDTLIAWAGNHNVLVERWGPIWLDLLGVDPFRRVVVGASLNTAAEHDELPGGLKRLPALQYLEFRGHLFTLGSAAKLGDMRQLRTLIVRGPIRSEAAAHECFAWLGKLKNLERLCLDLCGDVRGDDLGHLRGMTSLKSLRLERHHKLETSREWLAAIGDLTQLERLSLDLDIRAQDLAYLRGLTNLKSLALSTSDYYDEGEISRVFFETVGKLTRIERLSLQGAFELRSQDLAQLSGLANLKSLALSYGISSRSTLDDEDSDEVYFERLTHLPVLPQLETLVLYGMEVDDEGVRRLKLLPRLKRLDLTWTWVTDVGLAKLAPLESLEELSIDHRMATAAGLESLIALKRLKAVHITGTGGEASVSLDDGLELRVARAAIDDLRRALRALRQSKPRIVIDTGSNDFSSLDKDEFEEPSRWSSDKWVSRGEFHSLLQKCINER